MNRSLVDSKVQHVRVQCSPAMRHNRMCIQGSLTDRERLLQVHIMRPGTMAGALQALQGIAADEQHHSRTAAAGIGTASVAAGCTAMAAAATEAGAAKEDDAATGSTQAEAAGVTAGLTSSSMELGRAAAAAAGGAITAASAGAAASHHGGPHDVVFTASHGTGGTAPPAASGSAEGDRQGNGVGIGAGGRIHASATPSGRRIAAGLTAFAATGRLPCSDDGSPAAAFIAAAATGATRSGASVRIRF